MIASLNKIWKKYDALLVFNSSQPYAGRDYTTELPMKNWTLNIEPSYLTKQECLIEYWWCYAFIVFNSCCLCVDFVCIGTNKRGISFAFFALDLCVSKIQMCQQKRWAILLAVIFQRMFRMVYLNNLLFWNSHTIVWLHCLYLLPFQIEFYHLLNLLVLSSFYPMIPIFLYF